MTDEGGGTYYSWVYGTAGLPVEGFDVYTEFIPNQRIADRLAVQADGIPIAGAWTASRGQLRTVSSIG